MLRNEADAAGELVLLLERGERAYLRRTLASAMRCDAMRCEARPCDKLRYDAIAMRCDAGARWDAMRGARTWDKASAGELGATAGAGVFAPGEKRGRRCELLKRD